MMMIVITKRYCDDENYIYDDINLTVLIEGQQVKLHEFDKD